MATLANIMKFMKEGHDFVNFKEIVEIEETGEKLNGYGDTPTCRVKGEKNSPLYLKTNADSLMDGTRPIDWYYVHQWQSWEDSYSGFLLIPYGRKGKFLKIEYGC